MPFKKNHRQLTTKEYQKIVIDWNKTEQPFPLNKTIQELFEEQVEKTPNNIALVFNKQLLTYKSLNEKANQVAWALRKFYTDTFGKKLKTDTLIGLCVERGMAMIIGVLGIIKAGGAYVPMDPTYPKDRIKFMLNDIKVKVILADQQTLTKLPFLNQEAKIICLDSKKNGAITKVSLQNPNIINKPTDLAYVIYTSGSTGIPKGVMIEHRSVVNLICVTHQFFFTKELRRASQFMSINFDVSVLEIFTTLTKGLSLYIIPEETRKDVIRLHDFLLTKKIEFFSIAPALLKELPHETLPRLKVTVIGGESCDKNTMDYWSKQKRFINSYGPTECTVYATYCVYNKNKTVNQIGKPIQNTITYVLDPQLNPVPIGIPGELYLGGIGLARGYLHRPKLTREKFINNPFITKADKKSNKNTILYKTGDLVKWLPSGDLEFLGRIDNQVKIRGFRVELGEIEAILNKHPLVKKAIVTMHEEHGEKSLVAYYTLKKQTKKPIQINLLREFLLKKLPDYMLPNFFTLLDKFPLTLSGKIDRNILPPPTKTTLISATECVLPLNETEKKLVEIWQKLLAIEPISTNHNFFELGGHSLLLTHLLFEIKKAFKVFINISDFVTDPTIKHTAKIITNKIHKSDKQKRLQHITSDISLLNNIGPPSQTANPNIFTPKAILLTGVTGFLSVYLLATLLKKTNAIIYCLVRSETELTAQQKAHNNFRRHRFHNLINNPRIKIIPGDFAQPLLGLPQKTFLKLAKSVDSIYHSGAFVNHIFDYNKLRIANVLGTLELLKLACHFKNKVFHFVSTISSVSNFDQDRYALETGPGNCLPRFVSGYNLTKWAAEKILWQAKDLGFLVNIYRPGNITGDTKYGICHPEANHLLLLLKGCIQLQASPKWQAQYDMTPVDILAQAIIELSLQNSTNGKAFNLHNPHPPSWCQYIKWVAEFGFNLKLIQPQKWHKRLFNIDKESALFPLLPYYLKDGCTELHEIETTHYQKTQRELMKLNIRYTGIDKNYIFKCLQYLVDTNFLSNPH